MKNKKTPKLGYVRSGRTNEECWPWPGRVDNHGQPAPTGKGRPARLFYEVIIGPIPDGMVLKKTCGNVICVNPYHMEAMVWNRGVVAALKANRIPRKNNDIVVTEGVGKVPLGRGLYALVDEIDLPLVQMFCWHARHHHESVYAVRCATNSERAVGAPKEVRMHRVIAPPPTGMVVDHKDGDGLNNRRENLRHATHTQNMWNRRVARKNGLGLKGVRREARGYSATIKVNGVTHQLGVYATADQAAAAYDEASLRLHGEFGRPSRGNQ